MANEYYTILDATLREGEQQAGVQFAPEDKAAIVGLLKEFGVTLIEVGHPGISTEHERICASIAEQAEGVELLMHARADTAEVLAARRAGADWIGIWAGINELALRTKFPGHNHEHVCTLVQRAIAEAKEAGARVRFTVEDASRTDRPDIDLLASAAVEAGADRISLADTVGVLEPTTTSDLIAWAVDSFDAPIEFHAHDDLGLALANALAALDAGAEVIDASVLGIGERTGTPDLLSLATALHHLRGDDRFALEHVGDLAQAVQMASGFAPDATRPVVGLNAFTHASTYHARAVRRDPQAYEAFPPETVGRGRIVLEPDGQRPQPRLKSPARVGRPFPKESAELDYHRDGPGQRWVLLDDRVDDRASFYVMRREISPGMARLGTPAHVDVHRHHCDSALIFMGHRDDATGLRCAATMDGEDIEVASPATVYIPAGVAHSYRYLDGWGSVLNTVLSGSYNSSLIANGHPWRN